MMSNTQRVRMEKIIYLTLLFLLCEATFAADLHYEEETLTTFDLSHKPIKHGHKYTSIETDAKAKFIKFESIEADDKMKLVARESYKIVQSKEGWLLIDLQNKMSAPIRLKTHDTSWPLNTYSYTIKKGTETLLQISVSRSYTKMKAEIDILDWKGVKVARQKIEGKHIQETEYLNKIRSITSSGQ